MKLLLNLLFLLFYAIPLLSQDIGKVHKEMLYPVVRVRANDVGGSGTVVYSQKNASGIARTYIITNHHVIAGLIELEEKWDSVLKRKNMREVTKTAFVEFFKYNNYSHNIGSFAVEADIVAYSHYEGGQDWALLELRDRENVAEFIAHIYPRNEIDKIHLFDQVYAVGASLGHAPIITVGHINYMDDEIDNFKYWMSSANSIYGNSGGAVFYYSKERDRYEFIGIPSRISVIAAGFSATPISWMGYFIPINRIYDLIDNNCFQFIYDNTFTYEQCEQARKDKQKQKEVK